jgi:subtilisin family serine protease
MKLTKRRITVGLISTAVVATMTSVSTWALAGESDSAASNVPVQLVIGYKNGADRVVADQTLSAAGARVSVADGAARTALTQINASRVTVSSGRSASMIAALRKNPNVAYVERDVQLKAFDVIPTDPTFKLQNEMYTVRAPQAWETTTGSAAVTVAVIDTGVNAVEDLAGATVAGYDFVNNDASPVDDKGHGTSVASLIAARGNNGKGMAGVCWSCKIMPVKVLDAAGNGSAAGVAQGIIWAVQKGARILNLSLGSAVSSKVLADAVVYAQANGALVVAAAGNEYSSAPQYPAAYNDVLAVAATNRCPAYATDPTCSEDTTTRAEYSSYGASWVDVAAPGNVLVMDKVGNYPTGEQGTSFAAPIVAGTAALVRTQNPSYTGWSLAGSIYAGAKRPVDGVKYGLIDIPASLNVPTDRTAPTANGIGPAAGSLKRGTFNVYPVGLADPNSGIQKTNLWVNGVFKSYATAPPFGVPFNSAAYKGATKIELRMYDKAGNVKTIANTITVDNVAPSTRITSAPANNSKVRGTVTIKFAGSDQYGMAKYELLINGAVKQTHTAAPFAFAATSVPTKFTVQVRGFDKAGNSSLSTKLSYTR